MARSDISDIREIRKYAGEVQRVAGALSDDKDFAKRVVDAVHTGSSAEVEKIFAELDVHSDVRITTVDGSESGHAISKEKSKASNAPKTKTFTLSIGIGPFSISVSVKKESK